MSMEDLLNAIIERESMLGSFALESVQCYNEGHSMAALACLFLLAEHAIKLKMDVIEGDYGRLLRKARKDSVFSEEDFVLFDFLRKARNKMFHENHYAWSLEIRGVQHLFSEENTKRLIYSQFAEPCFRSIIRLL